MAMALFHNNPCPGYARGQSPLKRQIRPRHICEGAERDAKHRTAPTAQLVDPGARQARRHRFRRIAPEELPGIHE
jgi:hypothetical protein